MGMKYGIHICSLTDQLVIWQQPFVYQIFWFRKEAIIS